MYTDVYIYIYVHISLATSTHIRIEFALVDQLLLGLLCGVQCVELLDQLLLEFVDLLAAAWLLGQDLQHELVNGRLLPVGVPQLHMLGELVQGTEWSLLAQLALDAIELTGAVPGVNCAASLARLLDCSGSCNSNWWCHRLLAPIAIVIAIIYVVLIVVGQLILLSLFKPACDSAHLLLNVCDCAASSPLTMWKMTTAKEPKSQRAKELKTRANKPVAGHLAHTYTRTRGQRRTCHSLSLGQQYMYSHIHVFTHTHTNTYLRQNNKLGFWFWFALLCLLPACFALRFLFASAACLLVRVCMCKCARATGKCKRAGIHVTARLANTLSVSWHIYIL